VSSGIARVQSSAALSMTADLVPESRLPRTTAVISTAEAVAVAAGPAIAAVVLSFASTWVLFLANGVTFLASALLVLGLPRTPAASSTPRPGPRPESGAGARAGAGQDEVQAYVGEAWPLLAARAIVAVGYGLDVVLLAVLATESLAQGTAGYGWLLAGAGAGGLASGLLLRARAAAPPAATPVTYGLVLSSLPLLVFVAEPALGVDVLVQVVRGFGAVLVTATVLGALQRTVPSRVAGRVFGLTHSWVLAGTAAGALVAPLLLKLLGLSTTLVVAALVPTVAAAVLLPLLRRLDARESALLSAADPTADVLRRLTIFADASRDTLYQLAEALTVVDVDPGGIVVKQGGEPDALYVLVEGSVDVTVSSQDGDRHLRTMQAPAYFGEIGIVHGVARTATVTASDPCRLWRIPAESFRLAASAAGLSSSLVEDVRLRLLADAANQLST
jgi:predicted MFS family arabinose efflux permease